MKTKSISKTISAGRFVSLAAASVKKTFFLLLLVFALMPSIIKAQTVTGIMTGTGMGACQAFSFNTTTSSTTLSPLNYGNQNYACTGLNDDDISFDPQGNAWRVQIKSWEYEYKPTTGTGTLQVQESLSPFSVVNYTFTTSDKISTTDYSTQGGVLSCRFLFQGNYLSTTYYRRDNWIITSP
jgi:hypothetical protein